MSSWHHLEGSGRGGMTNTACFSDDFFHPAQIGEVREGKYCMRIVFAVQERHLQFLSVNFSALPEVRFGAAPVCLNLWNWRQQLSDGTQVLCPSSYRQQMNSGTCFDAATS